MYYRTFLQNEARLKINMEKCQFFKSEFKLLGFKVNRDGIWPDNDRLQLIQNWPLPKTYKELERFLGVVNFHRSFSPQFASICAPLDHKSKKGQIIWNSQMSEAFRKSQTTFFLINWLCNTLILTKSSILQQTHRK